MAGEICFHDNKPGNCPQTQRHSFFILATFPQRRPFFPPILPDLTLMFSRFVVQNLAEPEVPRLLGNARPSFM
jgi:hypothetical protein